jgi:hypothetical protein
MNKMSKEFLVESTCNGCPFAHIDVDFDSIGSEYYHTCTLARFLGMNEYCTGVSSSDDEEYLEGIDPYGEVEEIEWCPLKKEKEIIIKFKQK